MNAIKKLEVMIGKTFIYKNDHHYIVKYEIKNDRIFITTDKEILDTSLTDLRPLLNEFLPASSQKDVAVQVQKPSIDTSTISQLKDILMENIKEVKKDKNFIPQAIAINQNVNSIIELAKAEILLTKSMNQ
jgi:hypothetical protein